MRVLVTGGRYYDNVDFVYKVLTELDYYSGGKIRAIISGGAKGADWIAEMWADEYGVHLDRFPADWDKHKNAAGPIRNQQMIDEGMPDICVAFPGGKGTNDMVERIKKAGITLIDHRGMNED